ncbi:Type II secretion system (T2SS), protein F [Candidatus Tiddalikarchaeum anstoanum]|nr:Type II secretion system (T2SS), protein F [Candidatus Tiddalikarchaeum anstoanum]
MRWSEKKLSFAKGIYKRIEGVLPGFYKKHIMKSMMYAGVRLDYKEWVGFFFSYSIGIAITVVAVLLLFTRLEWYYLLIIFFGVVLFVHGISELLLMLGVRSRTLFVERILPDVVSLLSSNIRSGLTIDQALILSTRDEFGSFKEDLIKASKETLTGKSLGESLIGISEEINSKLLRKTVNLIIEGVNSGGELSALLENIASDIREMQLLKREIKAGIAMYTLILILASCVGAPLLFSVSLYEVETLQSLISLTSFSEAPAGVSMISIQPSLIDLSFLQIISVISLLINTIFGSLMIGMLESGNPKDGVRLIPFLSGLSIGMFFLIGYVVRYFFTGIPV